ncbi:SAM-dependent methyltransferase [Geothrix sp. PMB-07]|uniref:SAM-dependent methyltransferase n=1 Tax=Geothrix sp. PMB-07 TaxID=3068640 RepID=UPI002741CFB7|nr:SAM-dependent methyltransferase [Geothrix sp. PMB-07]WLT31655.1 SAM-dependent methyltransferase [Geothrix sp. PMB-07]
MNPLNDLLQSRLAQGPVPASEVMALGLYHPEHGYYRRQEGPWGFEGKDYYTALDLGPLLGQTLALRLEAAWERLDRPAQFTALEPGAGRGWLGRDVLSAVSGPFAEALVYVHRDDNPAAREAAERALAPFLSAHRARFAAESEVLEPFTGAIFSNELFDALPAQPWRWDGECWTREVLTVTGPEWQVADPGEAGAWFASQTDGLELRDGSVWCEGLPSLVQALTTPLQAGLFLAVDYGESADRLLAKGADLRRFKAHGVDGKWHEDLGEADLTADVDFTRLSRLLEAEGLSELGHVALSKWIRTHAPLDRWGGEWMGLPEAERKARTENLLQLTLPNMMGSRFRVLEGWKAAGA